jgi:hypothetical protein
MKKNEIIEVFGLEQDDLVPVNHKKGLENALYRLEESVCMDHEEKLKNKLEEAKDFDFKPLEELEQKLLEQQRHFENLMNNEELSQKNFLQCAGKMFGFRDARKMLREVINSYYDLKQKT